MGLNFKIWLEEKSSERRIRNMFLKRLGFDKGAMDDSSVSTMKISSYRDRIEKALRSMGLEEDKTNQLLSWMRNYPERTLQDLLNQIDPRDLDRPQQPTKELPGQPAKLPSGSKMPPPGDKGPAPSMQGLDGNTGIPPTQASMQLPY